MNVLLGPGNDGGRWNLDSILKFVFVFVFSQRPAAQPFHNGGAKMGNKTGFKPVFMDPLCFSQSSFPIGNLSVLKTIKTPRKEEKVY